MEGSGAEFVAGLAAQMLKILIKLLSCHLLLLKYKCARSLHVTGLSRGISPPLPDTLAGIFSVAVPVSGQTLLC